MARKIIYPLVTLVLIVFFIELLGKGAALFIDGDGIERVNIPKTDKKRIVCIGESTTEGGYPEMLQTKLDKIFPGKYKVYNLGETGVTSLYFKQRINAILEDYEPHYIISMLGINDTFKISKHKTKIEKSFFEELFLYKIGVYIQGLFSTESLKSRAMLHLNRGEHDDAYSLLYKVYKRSPESLKVKTLQSLAEYLNEEARQFKDVLEIYDYIVEKRNGDFEIRIDRMWIYLEMGMKAQFLAEEEFFNKEGNKWFPPIALMQLLYLKDNNKALYYFRNSPQEGLKDQDIAIYSKLLVDMGKIKEAEELINKRISENKSGRQTLLSMKRINMLKKQDVLKEEILAAENEYLKTNTIKHYKYIIEAAIKKEVGFYTMQYPMRSTKGLRDSFEKYLKDKSVRMIDNEKSFKNLVEREGYDKVFTDSFAIDFGHMTQKGRTLLVSNIVDAMDL